MRHAPNDGPHRGAPQRGAEAQSAKQRHKAHLPQRPQADLFDPHRARIVLRLIGYVHTYPLRRTRVRLDQPRLDQPFPLPGHQPLHELLGFGLDRVRHQRQQLLPPEAVHQHNVFQSSSGTSKRRAQIQEIHLLDLVTDPHRVHEAVGIVGLTLYVSGSDFPDAHDTRYTGHCRAGFLYPHTLYPHKRQLCQKTAPQALESAIKSRKSAELAHGWFKLG